MIKYQNLIKRPLLFKSMVELKKRLAIGISGLALLSSMSLYSQDYQINPEFSNKVNIENKVINYSLNDTIKEEKIIPKRKEFVENARGYLGTEYIWGGRLTKKNPGLDCLGLIFLAYSKTYETKWTGISVNPSEIVKKEQLGKPVKELDGILTKDIDFSKLEEGDVIYLLTTDSIKDNSLAEINKIKYWPWHTGIYSNKEKNLFLDAFPGNKVIEEDFSEVLNQKPTKAIFVTRIY